MLRDQLLCDDVSRPRFLPSGGLMYHLRSAIQRQLIVTVETARRTADTREELYS